jgi:hypothetical protein
MRILAIDPATVSGFATSNGRSGVWNLACRGTDHPGYRLARLRDLIFDEARRLGGLDVIAYEEASMGAGAKKGKGWGTQWAAVALHNQLRGVILCCAAELGAKAWGYHIGTLKAFATGSGRADKGQMIRAAETQFCKVFNDDNEADAFWILQRALKGAPPEPKRKAARRVAKQRKREARLF